MGTTRGNKKGNRNMSEKFSQDMSKEEMLLEIVDEWLYLAKHDTVRTYAGDRYTKELRKLSKKDIAEKYDAMVNDKSRMERKTWMNRKPMRRY